MTTMEVWKIKLFIRVCVLFVALDCLQLKVDGLICLIEECLAVALFLEDVGTQKIGYILLGPLYEQIYQIGKAIECYKKHLHIVNVIGDIKGKLASYEKLGKAYYLLGNYQEATKCQKECLNISKKIDFKAGEAAAYGNLGNIYQSLGDYQKAVEYQEKNLDIILRTGDRNAEGSAYAKLGNAYKSLGEYQKANEYHEKCLRIAMEVEDKELEGTAYGNLGDTYRSLGKYQDAIDYYKKKIGIATDRGDRRGEGDAYGNLGNVYHSLGKYREALAYHEKALKIAMEIGDRNCGEGKCYGNIGSTYQSLGKYQEAIEYQEKHLIIAKEVGDRQGEVSYGNLGIVYDKLGKYHEAMNYYKKGLSVCIEIRDRKGEGDAYGNIGNIYQSLGKYQEAISYYEKCLKIDVEIGNRKGECCVYGNLGNAYSSLGKYHRAKEYHEKDLIIAIDIGDRQEQENAYGNLGNVFYMLGKYQKAIEYHGQKLAIAMEIGDRRGEGAACSHLGGDYQAFGKYHEAKQYYEKQLSIAMEIEDRAVEGAAYGSIGIIHKRFGEYQKAIECQKKSLVIAVEIGDRKGEGAVYGDLGDAYQSLGKYHEAIEYQEKCLGIAKEIGDRRGEGAANGSMGSVCESLRKYQEAIEYHNKHLSIAVEIDDRKGQGYAHLNIGNCYSFMALLQDSDQPTIMKEAESHLKKSIQSFESIFDDLEQDEYKILIVDTFIEAYKRLAHVYIQTQQTDEALLVSDRGRARSLGELLTLKYSMKKETTSKSGSIDMTDIEMILSTNNFNILFYALQRKDVAYFWVLSHQCPLYFHHSEINAFESSLNEDKSNEIDEKSILNLVNETYDKLKVREGVKCEDRSLGFIEVEDTEKKPVSSQVAEQNTTKEREIDNEVNRTDARCIYDGDHKDDEKPLELLYDALVAPVQHMLVQDEIVIIPDGALCMVPFSAFQDPKTGQFLSETKRIRLAPSLMTLKVLQESSDDQHYKSGALIVGNPKIGKVKFEGIEMSFTELPGAEDEAKEIAKLLGVEPLIGRQATKEAVVQKLQVGVSVIHFAAHGSENGQILLAPSTSSATNSLSDEKDFILTMEEAQESGIRAQLVVLSCCHSGRGEIRSEGVVGMSRAFLAAGARAVVASLWAIDDEATKVFMLKFYSHLKKGESASKSLQQAMQEMRETETYKEPRYWAAFFLFGDDVTISV